MLSCYPCILCTLPSSPRPLLLSFSCLGPSCSSPLCYPQPSVPSCSASHPAPLSAFLSQLLLFLPVPFGISPFLVTLVPEVPLFSRSQQTWVVCPICTSSLSAPVGRWPFWALLSSSQLVSGAQLCSQVTAVEEKACPQAYPLCCCISLSSPAVGSHPQEHPWCASLPLVHTHPKKS